MVKVTHENQTLQIMPAPQSVLLWWLERDQIGKRLWGVAWGNGIFLFLHKFFIILISETGWRSLIPHGVQQENSFIFNFLVFEYMIPQQSSHFKKVKQKQTKKYNPENITLNERSQTETGVWFIDTKYPK